LTLRRVRVRIRVRASLQELQGLHCTVNSVTLRYVRHN